MFRGDVDRLIAEGEIGGSSRARAAPPASIWDGEFRLVRFRRRDGHLSTLVAARVRRLELSARTVVVRRAFGAAVIRCYRFVIALREGFGTLSPGSATGDRLGISKLMDTWAYHVARNELRHIPVDGLQPPYGYWFGQMGSACDETPLRSSLEMT